MIDLAFLLLVASVVVSYTVRRRVYLSAVDPLQLSAPSEGVWVVTVYQLALEGKATPAQVSVFATCILLWWASWWFLGRRWGEGYRRAMTAFWQRMADLPLHMSRRLTLLYVFGLLVFLAVTMGSGGGGDNRISIMKLLRPMESITTLLVPVVLFRLLIARGKGAKILLGLILTAMIATGGKSSILQLLIPVTGAALIGRIRLRVPSIVGLAVICFIGFSASVVLNYGVSSPLEILGLLYTRISLDGDVYLLALPNDLLAQTSTSSLIAYLLGPLIKVFFLPIKVDTGIGAQLFSLLLGEETPNGPNPHWPIVLLAYHQSAETAAALSLLCFTIVLALKLWLPSRSFTSHWPVWFAIPFNAFVLLYPQVFFADPSYPMIYLVQALTLSLLLSLVLRRAYASGPKRHGSPVHEREAGVEPSLNAAKFG